MRDPLNISFPFGRLFGIQLRVHLLFPVVALGLVLRAATEKGVIPGSWIDVAILFGLLFFSVLLHELGHCFGARRVDGDASEILIWPLGGLASVEVPHTARANLVTTICGPLVNLVLCVLTALLLLFLCEPGIRPVLDPFHVTSLLRDDPDGTVRLTTLDGSLISTANPLILTLARFFWVNWTLLLLNVLLLGFPLDGGRIFQCLLWPHVGYRTATMWAVFAGFITAVIVAIFAIVSNELLPIMLAIFIYFSCKQQWFILETGGEESMLGYDFSQGYTSLEREQPAAPAKRKQSWWQRWQQRRAARKLQRDTEQREAEERRLDELLQRIAAQGMEALTEEEKRFLKRASDRYRHR